VYIYRPLSCSESVNPLSTVQANLNYRMNAGKVDFFFLRVERFTIGSDGQKVSEKTKTDRNCWTPGNQSKALEGFVMAINLGISFQSIKNHFNVGHMQTHKEKIMIIPFESAFPPYPPLSDLLHSFSWGAVQSSPTDLEK